MKKVSIVFFLSFMALFFSCSSDIDLYADYKEVPIIYGLLDATADTNFVKITRAFYVQGDAYQIALNPDSSNYPGKLDARLVEYCNGDSIREILLDTITLHNKEQGIFYAPSQKLYYTTESLCMNGTNNKYSYRLKIVFGDHTLVTEADMVGNGGFDVQSLAVNFSKEYFNSIPRRFLFRPAINAGFYQVSMAFTFLEQRTPDSDSISRTMYWDLGYWNESALSTHTDEGYYVFYYRPEVFYEMLHEFIGGDTMVTGLRRYITDYPVEVCITAGGEKLRQYAYNNNTSNGFSQGDTEFSLIDGSYGVFSSRMTIRHAVRLAGETVPELVAERKWGFKFIGGLDPILADQ
ncbi:MAG: hypothetical protein K6G25_14140 [Bacteroidales bacterium]|nr:hypothetical protein [Bacteroidales bacterium]